MRHTGIVISTLAFFAVAIPAASPQSATPQNERNSIVIIFKDGHQKTYSLSEIERIEFPGQAMTASSVGQNRFLGEWRVGNGIGGHFNITLERGGVARKDYGSPNGTWEVVDGEARMSWDDGWHDVIRKAGSRYTKSAYSPGKTFEDQPDHTVSAESLRHDPV